MQIEQPQSHEQAHISDVEDPREDLGRATRPRQPERQVPAREHVEEVPNGTHEEPVVEIAQTTSEDKRNADMRQRHALTRPPREDPQANHHGEHRKADEQPALLLADAEHRAAVQDQMEVKQAPWKDAHTFVEGQPVRRIGHDLPIGQHDRVPRNMLERPGLAPQVKGERCGEHAKQHAPRPRRRPGCAWCHGRCAHGRFKLGSRTASAPPHDGRGRDFST